MANKTILLRDRDVRLDIARIIRSLKAAGNDAMCVNSGSITEKHGGEYKREYLLFIQEELMPRSEKIIRKLGGEIK
jgi:hypothetical protein